MQNGIRFLKLTLIVCGLVVGLGLLAALWNLIGELPVLVLRAWAVLATLLAVPLFAAGFYFGKVEARGVLHGFDQGLDKVARVIGDTANQREQSRAARAPAHPLPAGGYNVILPGVRDLPPITHRGGGAEQSREMIEL